MGDLIVSQSALPDAAGTEKFVLDLTQYEEAATNLLAQAERAEITDEETYAKGGDLAKVAGNQKKKIEDERKKFGDPFRLLVNTINDACKPAKTDLDKAVSVVKGKMLAWKKEEDRKRAEEARKVQEKLEQEALERAAAAKTEEDQDAIMEAAAEASDQVEERSKVSTARGSYGSTSSRKTYRTNVIQMDAFLESLIAMARNGEIDLGSIVDFRKSGLNDLAKYMRTERTAGKGKVDNIPGAEFIEDENLRVF